MPEPRDEDQAVPEPREDEETIPISVDAPEDRQRRAPTIRTRTAKGKGGVEEDEPTDVQWPPSDGD